MKLKSAKFNEVISSLEIQDRVEKMAYEIIVQGRSADLTGKKFNVSRQAAHRAACVVWNKYLSSIDCPEGWVPMDLVVPFELKERFEKIQKELFKKYRS